GLDLVGGRHRRRRSSTGRPQLSKDRPVWRSGAMMPRSDPPVEFTSQHRDALVFGDVTGTCGPGTRRIGAGLGRSITTTLPGLLFGLPTAQHHGHLVGVEDPGNAEIVGLLG